MELSEIELLEQDIAVIYDELKKIEYRLMEKREEAENAVR